MNVSPETGFTGVCVGLHVQVIHCSSDGTSRTLATRVRLRDGLIGSARGLIGGPRLTAGEAMVFRFRRPANRRVHTIFVRYPIDVVWVAAETVVAVSTLQPWSLGETALAHTIVELPAGCADDIEPDAVVRLVGAVEHEVEESHDPIDTPPVGPAEND